MRAKGSIDNYNFERSNSSYWHQNKKYWYSAVTLKFDATQGEAKKLVEYLMKLAKDEEISIGLRKKK